MTHKKNSNMYLKMLSYWDSGKETVSRNSCNYNLKWKHKNIHHIIYLIKKPILSDLKLYDVKQMRLILLLPL